MVALPLLPAKDLASIFWGRATGRPVTGSEQVAGSLWPMMTERFGRGLSQSHHRRPPPIRRRVHRWDRGRGRGEDEEAEARSADRKWKP